MQKAGFLMTRLIFSHSMAWKTLHVLCIKSMSFLSKTYLISEGIQDDDIDPEDLQPFPTLKRVFESVDKHTGFNIEVKYPMKKLVCVS